MNVDRDELKAAGPSLGALDILRFLMGLRNDLPRGFARSSNSISDLPWKRLRLMTYIENQLRAKHYVRAIHELTSKIPDLVVSNEVSDLIRDSINAVKEIDETSYKSSCLGKLMYRNDP